MYVLLVAFSNMKDRMHVSTYMLRIHAGGELEHLICCDDVLEYFGGVVCLERGSSQEQLVDQAAQGPVVHALVVSDSVVSLES